MKIMKRNTRKTSFSRRVLEMAKNCTSKNQNDLLPLKKSGQNILVIGALANDKTSPLGVETCCRRKFSCITIRRMQKYKETNYLMRRC
jgi:beta-glucosidase